MSGPLTRFGFAEETPEQRQEKILAGVMASVYRQVPQSVLVSIVGAFALVMVLWNSINQDLLLGWSLLILLESLSRLRLSYRFRRADAYAESVDWWAHALGRAGGSRRRAVGRRGLHVLLRTRSRCIRWCWSPSY